MSDVQSDQENETPPRTWMWVFLIVGLIMGFEENVQQMIAGRQTYMLLALIGATVGRAIDYFLIGRKSRGVTYLLPLAILIMLIAVAAALPAKRKLPQVDSPEVKSLVIRTIENAAEINAISDEIGEVTLTEVNEISFDQEKQERVARANLNSNFETEEIIYSVKWHDRKNGKFKVQLMSLSAEQTNELEPE